jgi:hypothetical protein
MPFDGATFAKSRLSPEALMSDPANMIAWLNTFAPTDVVTHDIGDPDRCLGANFLRAMGYGLVQWRCFTGEVDGRDVTIYPLSVVAQAISRLHLGEEFAFVPVTAARALEALGA